MHSVRYNTIVITLVTAAAMLSIVSCSTPTKVKQFGKAFPFVIDDLPSGELQGDLTKLTESLQRKALKKLHEFNFTDTDTQSMRVNNQGGIVITDAFLPPEEQPPALAIKAPTTAAARNLMAKQAITITANEAFSLHSLPGARRVIYIDFDGGIIENTSWNTTTGVTSYNTIGYDTDGSPRTFSHTELLQIAEIWRRVSEDYSPFNVDVTTEAPTEFHSNSARVFIIQNIDFNGAKLPYCCYLAGVASPSEFESPSPIPALVFYNNGLLRGIPAYVAEAASHELGHVMGIVGHEDYNDHINPPRGYYAGHGSGFTSWAPTMGLSVYKNVTQWSKGEYPYASAKYDGMAIISKELSYRADDHGNNSANATLLSVDSTGAIKSTNPQTDPKNTQTHNKGIIETRDDVDYFAFNTGAGAINLEISPAWISNGRDPISGSNLDIAATLYNQNGEQLASNDPLDDTNAKLSLTVPAGRYYLKIDGVGNNTFPFPDLPKTPNYTDYGSVGQYFISGSVISENTADTTPPTPNPPVWTYPPNAKQTLDSITMQVQQASDPSGPVQYKFICTDGFSGCVSSDWQSSNLYIATGLETSTQNIKKNYRYVAKVRDTLGNETALSPDASAYTDWTTDHTPPRPNPTLWAMPPTRGVPATSTVNMKAKRAVDDLASVMYRFICVDKDPGCVDSGWLSTNKYTLTGLTPGTTYRFQAQSSDSVGNQTEPSVIKSITTDIPKPGLVTNLTGLINNGQVLLNWYAAPYAKSYEIWRCKENPNGKCPFGKTRFALVTTNSYTGTVDPAIPYRYKVRAVNTKGRSVFTLEIKPN